MRIKMIEDEYYWQLASDFLNSGEINNEIYWYEYFECRLRKDRGWDVVVCVCPKTLSVPFLVFKNNDDALMYRLSSGVPR